MTEVSPAEAPPSRIAAARAGGPYAERVQRYERDAERLGRTSRLASNLRGLSFGIAVIAVVAGTLGGHASALPVGVVAALAFVAFVLFHARVIAAEDEALRMARVNLDGRSRLTSEWQKLPDDGSRFGSDEHPYSSDLDLFGPGSLYQRVNVAHTRYGHRALARFLTEPADPPTIRARQGAARALAPLLDERQRLEALSIAVVEPPPGLSPSHSPVKRPKLNEPPDPEPLLRWAEGGPWASSRPALVVAAYAIPIATLVCFLGARLFGWSEAVWTVPFAAGLFVVGRVRPTADRVFGAVSATEGAFLRYGPMFELVERLEVSAPLIAELKRGLVSAGVPPSAAMRRFERIVGWFDLRHNGLVHPFANFFLLWDTHCLLRLEAWQKRSGQGARRWFEALGEIEALSSFAGLAFDEPGFAWPEIASGPARFDARGLGHPLLPDDNRVPNDVALGEPGRALLVTGSNMSGKSTLLRAMGINAVLALAGGPVCASRLVMTEVMVRTSLKISDSLARGVSHFYAEVARLKGVVDATRSPTPVFFLLDEILHGTNSHERQVGARWVLAELIRCGALGAVSTHDVGLCELPDDLMKRVEQCHFREIVAEGRMSFDYRLRSGRVTGGNALRLMQLVGLPVPLDDDSFEVRTDGE